MTLTESGIGIVPTPMLPNLVHSAALNGPRWGARLDQMLRNENLVHSAEVIPENTWSIRRVSGPFGEKLGPFGGHYGPFGGIMVHSAGQLGPFGGIMVHSANLVHSARMCSHSRSKLKFT